MMDFIGRALDYPLRYDVEHSEAVVASGPEALMAFGKKLDSGEVHVGTMWGIEFGWLRQRYPELRPLALCLYGDKGGINSQMMVRNAFSGKKVDDLRGKILATYGRVTLMDKLFLKKTLDQLGETPATFFSDIRECKSVRDAVQAVNRGDADCVLLSAMAYSYHVANQPKIALRPLFASPAFAVVVNVGRPSTIEKLSPGLWRRAQEVMLQVHRSAEGKQCMQFWRLARFGKPDRAFEALVQRNVADYPISVLGRLNEAPTAPK